MSFLIADTFTKSLAGLTAAEQAAVKQAAFEFQMNPAAPGFNFESLEAPKDPNFRSFRVGQHLRVIVHQLSGSLMLCYVDHHDNAYHWAERRKIEVHPKTGAAQIVEVVEKEIVKPVIRTVAQDPPLFAQYEPDYLLALGVPPEWLDAVRNVDQAGLEKLIGALPEEAMERLMELAVGNPVPRPVAPSGATPFTHPDAQRRFRVLDSQEELRQALEYPWERWIVFLHPSQRAVVEKRFGGPASVSGAAGTGKSVVGLHRAVWLARQKPDTRVLLTTFSRTLAARLGQSLDILVGHESSERCRIVVENIHKVAHDLWERRNGRECRIISGKDLAQVVADAVAASSGVEFTVPFLKAEWEAVIDARNIRTREEYRKASRARRGTPLGARQKLSAWKVFEHIEAALRERGVMTFNRLCYEAAALVENEKKRPFDHVVADESQDLGPAELKLLRALAPASANDLFLCGDAGQRIYKAGFSWLSAGIDVRGRSARLKLNYRTTEPIRRFADGLLPGAVEGGAGEEEKRDSVSLLNGPEPDVRGFSSQADEVAGVSEWIRKLLDEGFGPHEIAMFGRIDSVIADRIAAVLQRQGLGLHKLSDDEPPAGQDVFVGTMHRAKGLEFKAVIVMGADAALVPLQSVLDHMADAGDRQAFLEQERNLLYVACSRARERLLVTYAGKLSPFLPVGSDRSSSRPRRASRSRAAATSS